MKPRVNEKTSLATLMLLASAMPAMASGYYITDGMYSGITQTGSVISGKIMAQFGVPVEQMYCYSTFLMVRTNGTSAKIDSYFIDYKALSEGTVRYIRSFESDCEYDSESQINTCEANSLAEPEKPKYRLNAFVEKDRNSGAISYQLLSKDQLNELKVTGQFSRGGREIIQFRCENRINILPFTSEPRSIEELKANFNEYASHKELPLTFEEWKKLISLLAN
jgi:hypothetical protein